MRLVHLTDPHLTVPPGWAGLKGRSALGKRYLGRLSWSRTRRHRLRREWLDQLTAEVHAHAPDQIVVSGDLTQLGTREELRAARDWLETLGPPEHVFLVPGNHDAYARESWDCLVEAWGPYLPSAGRSGYPVVRPAADDVILVGLNSALPTPPLFATGELGGDQLERLSGVLEAHPNHLKVLVVHHPPLPGLIAHRKRLRDAGRCARLLALEPSALVLHGHHHINRVTDRDGLRIFCTAPASARTASFRVLDRTTSEGGWALEMRRHDRTDSGFEVAEKMAWQVCRRP